MKKFDHDFIQLEKVNRIDGGKYRLYETPAGNRYPSVTSVLSAMSDNSWIQNWYDTIGKEEAERKTKRSAVRGNNIHRLCEMYILNQDIDFKKEMPFNVELFSQIEKSYLSV